MNIDHTIVLFTLDKIDNVKKLATDPISIVTASAMANHKGFPSANKSTKCKVEIIEERIGTDTKHVTIALFRNLLFISVFTCPAIF
jgi:hypothetical protein